MIKESNIFDNGEIKMLNDLETMVGKLSLKVALQQNEINNIKKDMADEKKRKLYDSM